MKNQNKTAKYKNKTKLTSNVDNKLNDILDRFLITSGVDQLSTKNISKDTKLSNNIEGDDHIFDLTGNEATELTQPKSSSANTRDKHTIIEMVDSDLEITYSGKAKSDTSIIANSSLDDKRKKKKKKKHTHTVPEKSKKQKKDRPVKNDFNLTDKEDNELFFFDLSGNKINDTSTLTCSGKSESDSNIIKKSKKKKRKIKPSSTISAISKKKKKDRLLFNDSQLAAKEDNELFFFDLSGSKTNSNLPQMNIQNNAKPTHFSDKDIEITYSGIDPKQNESKLVRKKKKKKQTEKELHKDDAPATKKKSQSNSEHWSQLQSSSLDLIGLIEEETRKRNRDKISHSDNLVLSPPKKKKKKIQSEPTEVDGIYTGPHFVSTHFSDHDEQISKEKKKKKKVKLEPEVENIETELNFFNNMVSDYTSEIPTRRKRNKKVKSAKIQVEQMEQSIDFFKNMFTDYNKPIPNERKKKSKTKSKKITSNQNNENEHGIAYNTFEEYLNMGQNEDSTFHISPQIPPESDKSVQPHSVNEIDNTVDFSQENVNNLQNKTETAYKKERTISEESFNTLINSIVGDSTPDEENSFNASLNEDSLHDKIEAKKEHRNYISSDFNFDTVLDTLINNLESKENKKENSDNELFEENVEDNALLNNNSLKKSKKIKYSSDALINNVIEEPHVMEKSKDSQEHIKHLTEENKQNPMNFLSHSQDSNSSISKKLKNQKSVSVHTNSYEVIDETEKELHIRKKKKKQKKTGEINQEQIEQNEEVSPSENSNWKIPKKSKKKKDKACSLTEHSADSLINSQIEELYMKNRKKDLVEENRQNSTHILNRSQDSDSSISKKSQKQKYSSVDPNSIKETEQLRAKKNKKSGDVKQEQNEKELTEEIEAYDTHLNSDCSASNKSKKKKDRTFFLTEHSSDALTNSRIEELYVKKKSKGSQQSNKDSTEENLQNFLQALNILQDTESKLSKKSKKQNSDTVDPNSSNTIEKSQETGVKNEIENRDEKKQRNEKLTEEIEACDTHVSPNEVFSDCSTPKKSKKKKTPHNSSIEEIQLELQNSQETEINSQNEAHLSPNDMINLSQNSENSPQKSKKKKTSHKSSIEETNSYSQETVINSQNEAHLSLNEVFNLLQNSEDSTLKKNKKNKTSHNSSIEYIESELQYSQETGINSQNDINLSQNSENSPQKFKKKKSSIEETDSGLQNSQQTLINSQNEAQLSLNEVFTLLQNSDDSTPKKYKKKKTPHNSSIEEIKSGLENSQERGFNSQNEALLSLNGINLSQNIESSLQTSKKKKTSHKSSIEETDSGLQNSQETVINSQNEACLSLNEVFTLLQNSNNSTPKKYKKKKTAHNSSIEEIKSELHNSQDTGINSQNEAHLLVNDIININSGSSTQTSKKKNSSHKSSIEETDLGLQNSQETVINSQNETHLSLNEVFNLLQNSEDSTQKKSKKKKTPHNSFLEETDAGLQNNQETVIDNDNKNETHFSLNEVFNISQNNDGNVSKNSKKKKVENSASEETESVSPYSQETVINSPNRVHLSLNEILNFSQNSNDSTPKKSKKKKTHHNSSFEEPESDIRYSQETVINENEAHLSQNDDNIPKKSNKKTSHKSSNEETEAELGNSQDSVINRPNEVHLPLNEVLNISQNNDNNTPKKSSKKKTSIEETESGLRNMEETVINSPNEVHLSLKEVLNLSLNSDSIISNESKKKTNEEIIQETVRDIFPSSEEGTLENMKTFLEKDFKRVSRERSILSEETKQDSGYEDSDNITKSKKKTISQSNEEKKNYSNTETNQLGSEKLLNTDSEDTGGERTLKRKKCGDSETDKQTITKKCKMDHVNNSVNIDDTDKNSKTHKLNVDDVFSDDIEEESSNKIKRRMVQTRRSSSYVSDRGDVIKSKKIRRTRSLSERSASDSDSNLNVTGYDVYDLTEEELHILRTLSIQLPFEDRIPPLHMIQRASKPTAQDVANAKIINAKFGSFTKDEDAQIIKNWKRFLKIHKLNVRPFVFFKFRRHWNFLEKIKFLQFLAHKLNDRMPFRVHARFKTIFESKEVKKGRYTFDEDKKIIEFMHKTLSTKPFYELGILLNRPATSVQMRYAHLTSDKNKSPIKWTTYMSERMVKAMMEIVKTENVKDLEHYVFKEAEWKQLSEILDNIPPRKLQRAWKITIHSRLFMKGTKQDIERQLINMMIENGEDDFRAISWQNYADQFRGVTARKLNDTFRILVRNVPKKLKTDLKSTLEYISLHLGEFGTSHLQYRYRLKNGKLVCKERKN
ncbi:unnamed protein product [Psylliodes chrysocephalus]|uniref:Uncharacterized protein n=1 Tax=Psylliodes chrysocephalus TaxID=3402493 RepID=A0A9P0CCN1_9CUCU|nr:unnamed protein product [Psylliodes chrysocephala]